MDDDLGWIRVRLGADFERAGFDAHDRAIEAAERKKKVETKLEGNFDDREFEEFERRLARAEARAKHKDAYKAALGAEFDGRAWAQAWASVEREHRRQRQEQARHVAALEKAHEDALREEATRRKRHIDQMARFEEQAHRMDAARTKQQLDALDRAHEQALRADAARTKRHLANMDRVHEQALRADVTRTKRAHAEMARTEATAYAENARRSERALRERERAHAGHLSRQERILGRFTKAGANVIPNLNWSTRIPVWGIVGFGVAIQAVIPPVVAFAGALEPLAGLLGALPTLAATAGMGMLTAFLGLKGVGAALGAAWEAQASAAEDGVDGAKRQEAAAESVKNAERQLADAIEAHDDAQQDANDTVREAQRDYRKLKDEMDSLAASEGDRVEALRQANEELGRLQAESASQREIAQARRDVTHAEYELTQARERRREATEKVRQVDQHGIQSLDEVKEANERVADAEERVTDATDGVAKANRDAARDMAELQGGAKKLDEAMRELGPAGQAFVTMVATKFFPLVKQLRSTAQEGLLPGLGDGMVEASKNADLLNRVVGRLARTMGGTGLDWGKFLGSKSFGRDFEQIMGQSNELLADGGDASIAFSSGLRHVAVEAEPLTGWLGKITKQLGLNFEGWAANNRENGKLRSFFRETVQATKDVVGALWDTSVGLLNIGRIGARVWGNDMRGGIRDLAADFRDWTESVKGDRSIEQYFQRWRKRWTAVADFLEDAIRDYQRLRREGASSVEALTQVITERFGDLWVNIGEQAVKHAPKVAWGFVKGFLQADALSKLVIGGWLLGKMGGRGAFLAIGRAMGGWIAGSMTAQWIRHGIAGRFIDWFTGPDRMTKFRGAGDKVGRVTGRAAGRGLVVGIVAGIALFADDILRAVDEHITDPLQRKLEELPGPLGDISAALGDLGNIMPIPGRDPKFDDEAPEPKTEKARRRWERYRKDVEAEMKGLEGAVARSSKRTGDALEISPEHRAARREFNETAKAIERRVKDGELSTEQGMRAIKRLVKTHSEGARGAAVKEFDDMGRKVVRRMRATKDDGGKQARGLKNAVSGAIGDMGDFVNGALKSLGLKPISFKASKVGSDVASGAEKIASGEIKASGGFVGKMAEFFAGGGLVGRWGERGRDKVHAILGRGEAVLNHYQQRAVNMALRASGVARGGLRELFGRTRHTRHYMASGGMAGGDGASIADYYPQAFAEGGYTQGAVPPQGSAIRGLNEELFRRGFSVTSGYRSTSSTYHGAGHASDYGDSVNDLPSLWRVLFPRRNQFAELFGPSAFAGLYKWGKQFSDPGLQSTHEDHIHVALLSKLAGALGVGGAGAPSIPRQVLSGPDGPLKAMGQKLIDRVRKGAQGKLNEAIGAASHGHGAGQSITVNADDLQSVNKVYPEHGLSDAAGHVRFAPKLVERIARWAGFGGHSDEMERIAHGESDYYPGIRGDDPGGTKGWGLWQNTPGVWGESGLNYLASLGGEAQLRNPLKNAKMAKFLYDAAGGSFSPWYGTKYLASGGFAGDGASIGDYFPSAGAFAAGGYTDDSAPVNIGGAVGGSGLLTGIGRKLVGSSPIEAIKSRISRNENRYQSMSRRFELDDGEFITEGTETSPPTLNMAAIENRAGDLRKLIAVRDDIYSDYQRLVFYIRRLRAVYRQMMNRLRKSVERVQENLARVGKGKNSDKRRKTLQGRLSEYQGALKGATDKFSALGVELNDAELARYDAHTDLMSDEQELETLLPGAKASLAGRSGSGNGDADTRARADQADSIKAAFEEYKRQSQAAFSVFSGPGDIGSGAPTAIQAAQNPMGGMGGPGAGADFTLGDDGRLHPASGGGSSSPSGVSAGQEGGAPHVVIHQTNNMLHPDDPAVLSKIGSAAVRGASYQGAVQANRSTVNV